jgi:hypothetical protein
MKAGPQANAFGQVITSQLRDPAIDHFDSLAASRSKAPSHLAIQARLARLDSETVALMRECVVQAIDSGIGHFLYHLQQCHDDGENLAVVIDGVNVASQSDGLHGEIWSNDGWFAKYSDFGENGLGRPE